MPGIYTPQKEAAYDFCGWVTRNDVLCSDGRTIRRNAFAHNDGETVPLVWNHDHNDPNNVLGKMVLQNRPEGVYGYGFFNDTMSGENAKGLVRHGDITTMSIYANQLKQNGGDVIHGNIREVSLVLAGANKEAKIETVIEHSDYADEEALIWCFGDEDCLEHGDDYEGDDEEMFENRSIGDIIDGMTDEEREALRAVADQAYQDGLADGEYDDDEGEYDEEGYDDEYLDEEYDDDPEEYADEDDDIGEYDEGDDDDMRHNIFDGDVENGNFLSHADQKVLMGEILSDAKTYGSLKESYIAHADAYGIDSDQIGWLFPDYHPTTTTPQWIEEDKAWVGTVMHGVHHTPFARVKTLFADITEEEARAKGYFKGNRKKDEVFGLLKRTTDPQTVYKKQKLDRDDTIDVTDFSIVEWIKGEMRKKLDNEIALAILLGDGRPASSPDKVKPDHIRNIWTDDELFTIHKAVTPRPGETFAKAFVNSVIRGHAEWEGTGTPLMFMGRNLLADLLLMEDGIGHKMYKTKAELTTALMAREIITVPEMDKIQTARTDATTGNSYLPMAIMVNLADYDVGADKGGAVNLFDDFDIDYNQMAYLIETRCSGALTKYHSAIAFEKLQTVGMQVEPEAQTTTISGKLVSLLQDDDMYVNSTTIGGTLKYVTGYTGYSDTAALQEGNFLALKVTGLNADDTATVQVIGGTEGVKNVDSTHNNVVLRIEGKTQKVRVVVTNADGETLTRTYSLSRLTLEKE